MEATLDHPYSKDWNTILSTDPLPDSLKLLMARALLVKEDLFLLARTYSASPMLPESSAPNLLMKVLGLTPDTAPLLIKQKIKQESKNLEVQLRQLSVVVKRLPMSNSPNLWE